MTKQFKQITFIGTGIMGSGMAINLLKAGHIVRLFTRSKKTWKDFPNEFQEVLNSKSCSQYHSIHKAVEGSDLIIICLTKDEVVEEIFFHSELFSSKPKFIIDTGTTSPDLTLKMWKYAKERDVTFLDAPMTGSKLAAQNGQILYMVGAEKSETEDVDYFFETCGKMTIHCGSISLGQRAKIALNMIQAGLFQIYSEGFILAEKEGVDNKIFLEILENSAAASALLSFKMDSVMKKDFSAHFALKNMYKDVNHAMQRSKDLHVILPIGSQLQPIFEAGMLAGYSEEDFCSLIKVNQLWNSKASYKI